jgi:hypothetical protein
MVGLRTGERLALSPHASLGVLEPAQLCVVPDVHGSLHDDKDARNEERAPHTVEKKQRKHPVWYNESLPLRAERNG